MSRMDFPSTNLVAGTTTHTVGDNRWLWNGYAWIKEPHGHTGAGVVDSICGVTGEICVCYPGLTITGQTLCIDRTATIHVAGISADESLSVRPTSDSYVRFPFSPSNRHFYIKGDGTNALYVEGGKLTVEGANLELTEGSELIAGGSISVGADIGHIGDTDTMISFGTNQIDLKAGGNVFVEGTDTNVSVQGSTFDSSIIYTEGISAGTGISGAYIYAPGTSTVGGCVIAGGIVVGTSTNSLACAGNAATSTSTTNITISASSTDADLSVPLVDNLGGGSQNSLVKVDSGAGNNGFRYNPGADLLTLGGVSAGHGATFGGAINLSSSGVRFSDGTTQTTAAAGGATDINTAVFTVQASSSISTGRKTLSMHRVPYNATITGFEVQASKAGGFTAAAHIAGPDWGNPLIGGITGASLALTGLTGYTNSLNHTSITGGNFLYLDVYSNAAGATSAQAFLTYQRS